MSKIINITEFIHQVVLPLSQNLLFLFYEDSFYEYFLLQDDIHKFKSI